MHLVKYSKPARKWREALPLGNGYTGVMVYGSLKKERLCFNDGTLWSGYPKDYNSKNSLENLEKARQLIFEGRNSEADALCEEKLSGFYSEAFMPLGEVTVNLKGISQKNYSRCLDLSKAIHTVRSNGCTAEAFSSYPDRISVYKVKADNPFSALIKAKSKLKYEVCTDENGLFLLGNAPDYAAPNYLRTELYPIRYNEHKGMAFCLQTRIFTNGTVCFGKKNIKVKNATELTLYFIMATGFNGFDKMPETSRNAVKEKCRTVAASLTNDYENLKSRHNKY